MPVEVKSDKLPQQHLNLPNGLSVLLISDSDNKRAAASLCVGVGSYSDPPHAPGLAHLLEHMLFVGTTKFPGSNEFTAFLSEHGGESNALTGVDNTSYFFDINSSYLLPALERFSQFFVSPLIDADLIKAELVNVNTEFCRLLQDDEERLRQLMCTTADTSHPFHGFVWGNSKSFDHCRDLREELVGFYKKHYEAQRMMLVVLGAEPLETLSEWVSQLFSHVAGGQSRQPSFATAIRPWPAGKLYRMKPVKHQSSLYLSWLLPISFRDGVPALYMEHLLANETSGSFAKFLKLKGWALRVTVPMLLGCSTPGYQLIIRIKLTRLGLDKIYEIIGHFYEYVRMLQEQGPQKWLFEELHEIVSIDTKFPEDDQSSHERIQSLSESMLDEQLIDGDYASVWDPKLLTDLLGHVINPGNMRVDVLTHCFDMNSADLLNEPYFDTPYTVEDIPQYLLDCWSSPLSNSAFQFPAPNGFTPRDLSLKCCRHTQVPCSLPEPFIGAWYKFDATLTRPTATVYVNINYTLPTLLSEVLLSLYKHWLEDALGETFYLAKAAGLIPKISVSDSSLLIDIVGYNDKLHLLVEQICKQMKEDFRIESFQTIKESLEQAYLEEKREPELKCLSSVSMKDLHEHFPSNFHEARVDVLCHGNLYKPEAQDIVEVLKAAIPCKKRLHGWQEPKSLPSSGCEVHNNPNENEYMSSVKIHVASDEYSMEHKALAELLVAIAKPAFYSQLRIVEQLGYEVDCVCSSENGILGLYFYVESSNHPPDYLRMRIEAFIERLEYDLEEMTDEVFEVYRDCLASKLLLVKNEAARFFDEIICERYEFQEPKLVASSLKKLTIGAFLSWFDEYIRNKDERRVSCDQKWAARFDGEY